MNIIDLLSHKQKQCLVYKNYKLKTNVFKENDFCDSVSIMVKGQVQIISYLEDGREVIYNTINCGQMFGNNLIFSSNPYYKGNIIAKTDCTIAFINKKELITLLHKNNAFMEEFLKIQSDFTKKLNDNIKILTISDMEERLYYLLKINNGKITYNSITELAKQLFIQRETLSRLLSKLVRQGKVKRNKNDICIL